MRARTLTAAAALALLLAACADDTATTVDDVEVTGQFGSVPVVRFEPPLAVSDAEVRELEPGDGPAVAEGDPTVLTMSTYRGEDGVVVEGAGEPVVVRASEADLGQTLHEAVLGATEGSRLLYAEPVETDGDASTFVTVVDVMRTRAHGEDVATGSDDVEVVMTDDGPTLTAAPDAVSPGALDITLLVRGEGPQVTPDSQVVAHYTVWTWSDGAVYDTTWADSPAILDLSTALPGMRNGLTDVTVGSRVLLEIPPAEGIGTDALVMLVDVLAVS